MDIRRRGCGVGEPSGGWGPSGGAGGWRRWRTPPARWWWRGTSSGDGEGWVVGSRMERGKGGESTPTSRGSAAAGERRGFWAGKKLQARGGAALGGWNHGEGGERWRGSGQVKPRPLRCWSIDYLVSFIRWAGFLIWSIRRAEFNSLCFKLKRDSPCFFCEEIAQPCKISKTQAMDVLIDTTSSVFKI